MVVIFVVQVVENSCICRIVEATHSEEATNDPEEAFVVRSSNAVVQPPAMMIEPVYASVALSAVLRVVRHVRLAHLAEVQVGRVVEGHPTSLRNSSYPCFSASLCL